VYSTDSDVRSAEKVCWNFFACLGAAIDGVANAILGNGASVRGCLKR